MRPPSGSAWRRIGTALCADPMIRLFAAAFVVVAGVYLAPIVNPDARRAMGWAVLQLPFLAIVTVSAFWGLHRVPDAEARRFWTYLGGSFVIACLARLVRAWHPVDTVFTEFLFLLTYLPFLLALERRPHVGGVTGQLGIDRRLRFGAVVCLTFGLFAYFVLVPASVDPPWASSEVAPYYWFLAMDVVLVTRCLAAGLTCRQSGWRVLYLALAVAADLSLLFHGLDALLAGHVVTVPDQHPIDLLWAGHYFAYLVAFRLRHAPLPVPPAAAVDRDAEAHMAVRTSSLLVAGACAFPIVHFGLASAGLLSRTAERAQATAALAGFGVMASLAIAAYWTLARRLRNLLRERHIMQARLSDAQRLEAVGRVAGGIAHDFNNLLMAVDGYTELALADLEPRHPACAMLAQVEEASGRAKALTRQLLAFSRRQMLDCRRIDLNQLVGNLHSMLGRLMGEDVRLEVALDPHAESVRADPGQLELVIVTLAAHARDAMPRGGTLTITTAAIADAAAGRHDLPATARAVEIVVRDTGPAIPADEQAHVFEPFFAGRDRRRPVGLGLAAVHGIVTQSGGTIAIRSDADRGTAFVIRMPAAEPESTEAAIGG